MSGHWDRYHRHWNRLGPPLRPGPETVAIYRDAVDADRRRLLLYGVTPELAGLGRELVAVDGAIGMIRDLWPGDGPGRRALQADWTALPLADGSVGAALGDGAFNANPLPGRLEALLAELARVLAPGGRAAVRVFCRPELPETLEAVSAAAWDGEIATFHALKWRLAMVLAGARGGPNVAVRDILAGVERLFPDRAALAARTGWPAEAIDTIDAYAGSDQVYAFPTRGEILALVGARFPRVAAIDSGDYPLSERCPLIVFRKGVGP